MGSMVPTAAAAAYAKVGYARIVGLRTLAATFAFALLSCARFSEEAPPDAGGDARAPALDAAEDAAPPATPSSCRALLEARPALARMDGTYTIKTASTEVEVGCDMTVDGGGWTLVGRSGKVLETPPAKFGWKYKTGRLDDLAAPYSLGATIVGVAFKEVLVTTIDRTQAFKFVVRSDFLASDAQIFATGDLTHVAGPCKGTPEMLRYAGAIELDDTFFLRDVMGTDQHRGLNADRLNLTYEDCDKGGGLDDKPGAIFVR